ncbi:hypothetical protein ID866_1095 [Astraeus odoratus]|nr:hypothetical protein ID866_1095 [Astraeus odoratus]
MKRSSVQENPTLRNISHARNGREYTQRVVQRAREEAQAARREADQARLQAASALRQAEEARRQAEEAIFRMEQAGLHANRADTGIGGLDAVHQADVALWVEEARGRDAWTDHNSEYETAYSEDTRGSELPEEMLLEGVTENIRRYEQEAEAVRQSIWEERERARRAQDEAAQLAREATARAEAAKEAEKEAEARLKMGIQPIIIPSPEEVTAAKARVQYQDGLFHFAVAGVSGSGKSSLINAFRGLHNKDVGAARTGIVETTSTIDRYPDPDPDSPFVWYDIPGAGTLQQSDWLYFNNQGLFVFDCVIILFDTRFTKTDLAILINCRRFQIPTYIVRSKSDAHIRNIMRDLGYESESDGRERRMELQNTAREQYIAETRATVLQNLREANLPDQRAYVVCNTTMLSVVKNRTLSPKIIDEMDLMKDLLEEARSRRCVPQRIFP